MAVVPTSGFRESRAPAPAPIAQAEAPPVQRFRPTNDERLEDATAEAFGLIRRREIERREVASEATRRDPQRAARANEIAPWVGVPPEMVEDKLDDYEGELRASAVRNAMDRSLEMASWLSNPRRAAVSHDDIEALEKSAKTFEISQQNEWDNKGWLGKTWQTVKDIGTGIGPALAAGAYGAAEGIEGAIGATRDFMEAIDPKPAIAGFMSDVVATYTGYNPRWDKSFKAGEEARRAASVKRVDALREEQRAWRPLSQSWVARDILSGTESVPLAAASLLTRSSGMMAGVFGVTTGGKEYMTAREQGLDLGSSLAFAARQGAVETITEKIPAMRLVNDVAARSPFLKTFLRQLGAEIPGEQAATLLQEFDRWVTLNPEKSFADYAAEVPAQAGQTLLATLGAVGTTTGGISATQATVGAVDAGTRRIVKAAKSYVQARADARTIDQVMEEAAASKTRERDPRLFEEFIEGIAQGTPIENVFVPAEAIRELYQSNGWEMGGEDDGHLSGMSDDFWQQVDAGLQSGGDVVIPIAAVAAHLAGTPEWEAIRSQVRVSPGGNSLREAEAFEAEYAEQMAQLAEQVAAQALEEREAAAPRERVFEAVLGQAREAGFSVNAARAYADLWADRYQTRAERLGDGRTALDLFEQSFAGIREDLPERVKPYRKGDGLDVLINAIKTGAERMTPRAKSLVETIVEGGGVIDDGGDIKSMGGDKVVRGGIFGRARKSLIRDQSGEGQGDMLGGRRGGGNDFTLDAWAERLQGMGFFGDLQDRASVNDVIDAIGTELRGYPVYPTEAELDPVMEANNALLDAADDLREILDRLGVDVQSATREEIDAALARWEAEGDAAFGFDQAGSEAFKRWFGDSKVVDENGAPLVVYHGTNQSIEQFDASLRGQNTGAESAAMGFFFSDDTRTAESYANFAATDAKIAALLAEADKAEAAGDWSKYNKKVVEYEALDASFADPQNRLDGQNVLPVYLSIKDPLVVDAAGENAVGFDIPGAIRRAFQGGHDGLIINNLDDAAGLTNQEATHYVVFDPAQIKSVNNVGSFDPADPRILYQQGARGRIDFLADSRAAITLFEGRDLSTLLHEGGHLWLEELRGDALSTVGQADASDTARKLFADWEAVKAWFKREGIDVNDSDPIPTEAHELWARGMERYFMEGKAPSSSLATAFASFRAWLLRIYKVVANLNSNIDDDVRGVFDRLLATDQAIAWAIHEADERALFETVVPEGMSGQERLAYMELIEQSRTEAFDALLYRTMERVRRKRTVRYQEEEAKIRAEVAGDIEARPEFAAMRLVRGVGVEHMPLDLDGVIARVGRDAIPLLPRGGPRAKTIVAGGVNPDIVAENAGFPDGKTMLEALIGVEERRRELIAAGDKRTVQQEAVDLETEARMAERHGDIFDDGSIEEEALEIIQTDAGSERLASEIRQLSRAIDPKDADGPPTPLDVVRRYAERVVREGRIVDQASGAAVERHRKAKAKASREAERSYLNGDNVVALKAKQREMIASELWRASRAAKEQVDVIARRLDRFARTRHLKGMDQEYLERIHEVLESYDLRPRSRDAIRERERFDAWAKEQAELGFEVFVPERLTLAGNKHFTKLTYEEIVAIDDTVQSLAHLGRQKMELLIAQEERQLEDLVERAEGVAMGLPLRPFTDARNEERRLLAEIDAGLVKMEFIADQMDNGDPNGVFNEVLIKGATEAANEKERLTRQVVDPLAKMYLEMPKRQRKRLAERVTVPEFVTINPATKAATPTTFTRAELLAVALNTGNASNLEKMLVGETLALPEGLRGRFGWTEDRVMAVLDRELTQDDWKFVEKIWIQINSLWPDIARSEREISGVAPEKIEGRAVQTKYGTFQGGYYPVVFDPARDQAAADNADGDAARILGQIGRSVSTPKGHTITRTDAAKPLHYSLERVLFNHVNRVTTRIAYGRYARDVLKFAGHPKIRKLVSQHIGPEYHRQIKGWLQRQVNDAALDTAMLSGIERVFRQVRVNATMVGLGLRFTTMAAQLGGWANSAAEIGPLWMARGMKEVARNGMSSKLRDWVFAQSPELAGRAEAFDRDVRTFYREAGRKLRGKRPGRANRILDGISAASDALGIDKIQAGAFWAIGMIDVYLVAMPTWVGAYYKAIESMDMDVAQAIAFADKSVRKSQSAGRAKDLSAFQDSNEGYRQLTTFYTYFSVLYNKQRETNVAFRQRDWRRAMTNIFWIMMVGPLASALLTGDWPEDDDRDVDGWMTWAASRFFFGLWSGVPVLRDVAGGLQREIEGKYTGAVEAPFFRAFSEVQKPVEDAIKLSRGEEPSERWLKNAITPIGYFVGLPTGQVGQTAQYLADVSTGEQNPDSLGDVVVGVAKGPQDDQE